MEEGELDAGAEEGEVDETMNDGEEDEHETQEPGEGVQTQDVSDFATKQRDKDNEHGSDPLRSKKRKADELEDTPSLDQPYANPFLGIVARLNQGQAISLLQYHLKWLRKEDITNAQLRWLFALFSRVDPLLTAEEVSVVRDVCRRCRKIRASLAGQKVPVDDARIAGLNMIIAVVGGPFLQRDLR